MKQQLINLYNNWSVEAADKFYNHTPDRKADGYIWEVTPNGIFLVREHGSHFISNDGFIYKLHNWFMDNDIERHTELLARCTENNIRIDIPVYHEFIELNGKRLQYSIVQRPNKEHGKSFYHYMMTNGINRDYFLEYIKLTADMMKVMKSMSCLLPDVSLPPNHLIHDSKGPFWCDFKVWSTPYEKFVLKNVENYTEAVTILENYLHISGLIDTIHIAEDTWTQI